MDRLVQMDREAFVVTMLADVRRIMGQIADAVNAAPAGRVINDSEERVRDLMAELRQLAFQQAVQSRVDSTESAFSPSGRRVGPADALQGGRDADRGHHQWPDHAATAAIRFAR
jgi:hypothetical protein